MMEPRPKNIEEDLEESRFKDLKRKWVELYKLSPHSFSHDSEKFAATLRKNFKEDKEKDKDGGTEKVWEFEKYRLFHLLAGSTYNNDFKEFDFPGHLVENFINDEYKKMFKEREEASFE
ncbi:MAG: hypothetical protein PHT40_01915 [Patescibacteria group bacterium]|nr:hypothetical protein [Patescibacteria group bacterium]